MHTMICEEGSRLQSPSGHFVAHLLHMAGMTEGIQGVQSVYNAPSGCAARGPGIASVLTHAFYVTRSKNVVYG